MLSLVLLLATAQPISLAQALERAAQGNADVRAAQLAVPVAEAGVQAAGQLANPTVGVSVGPDEPTVFGTVDVKLPIFGQRGTAVAAAAAEVDVARAEALVKASFVRAAVRRAYFALGAADAQTALAGETAQLAAQLADMTGSKFRTGSAPKLEAEQALLARRRAEQDRADRESAANDARAVLQQLLGAPPGVELRAADPIERIPDAPPLEQLLAQGGKNPEVQSLLHQRAAALARAARERAAVRPVPDVSLEVERLSSSPGIGLRAGLAFEAPFFNWNGGRVREAEAQASVAEAQGAAARRRVESEIRSVRARWQAAAVRAHVYADELVPSAQRLLEMARAGYELGRAPLVSVLQAQNDLSQAKSRAVDAANDAQRAYADLEEAVGATF